MRSQGHTVEYLGELPADALTSSDPDGHKQIMDVIPRRLKSQIFTADVATVLEQWA